jgi:hypothetical protein
MKVWIYTLHHAAVVVADTAQQAAELLNRSIEGEYHIRGLARPDQFERVVTTKPLAVVINPRGD